MMYVLLDDNSYVAGLSSTPLRDGLPEPFENLPFGFEDEALGCWRYTDGTFVLNEALKFQRQADATAAQNEAELAATRTQRTNAILLKAAAPNITDDDALDNTDLWPEWVAGNTYASGEIVQHQGGLYRCIQAHTSQADWPPDQTPALWRGISDPADEWPDWVQPTGGHDAYQKGDKVTYGGKHWISTADSNVWAPGVYGWEVVTNG